MAIHVAQIALIQIDSETGLPFTKESSPMNKYTSVPVNGVTRPRTFTTEHRIMPDTTNIPNSADYPTIPDYLTAENADGYLLVHMDQTYVITQT